MKRVVITGMGLVTPLGLGVEASWKRLINGESGLSTIESFDTSELSSKIAGIVPRGPKSESKYLSSEHFPPKESNRIGDFIEYGVVAAREALEEAKANELSEEDKELFGVHVGAGIGGLKEIYDTSCLLNTNNYRRVSPFFIPSALINLTAGHISIEYGLKGPNISVVTACATGTHSIGDAARLIKCGEAKMMIAGASEDPVNLIGVGGFARMNALSKSYNETPQKGSRPWDKGRDGFVIAEGGACVVLEELEHAKARGAKIYAEVVGYGMSGDAGHITAPCAEGKGAARCMEAAIKSAGIDKSQIGYVNAHGTSTPLGDKAELAAITSVFGDYAKNGLSISSTKSAIGHTLGAAGAIEAIFVAKALEEGILPPTLNLDDPEDFTEGYDLVPHKAKKKDIEYAMSNSFGFGGTNGTLILKKYND